MCLQQQAPEMLLSTAVLYFCILTAEWIEIYFMNVQRSDGKRIDTAG